MCSFVLLASATAQRLARRAIVAVEQVDARFRTGSHAVTPILQRLVTVNAALADPD